MPPLPDQLGSEDVEIAENVAESRESAAMKLRDPRFRNAQQTADVAETHSLEVVQAHDRPFPLREAVHGAHQRGTVILPFELYGRVGEARIIETARKLAGGQIIEPDDGTRSHSCGIRGAGGFA